MLKLNLAHITKEREILSILWLCNVIKIPFFLSSPVWVFSVPFQRLDVISVFSNIICIIFLKIEKWHEIFEQLPTKSFRSLWRNVGSLGMSFTWFLYPPVILVSSAVWKIYEYSISRCNPQVCCDNRLVKFRSCLQTELIIENSPEARTSVSFLWVFLYVNTWTNAFNIHICTVSFLHYKINKNEISFITSLYLINNWVTLFVMQIFAQKVQFLIFLVSGDFQNFRFWTVRE